ncbi:MAG: DUF2141 domain-containing protein [Bacteroidota bacterium]
MTKIFLEFLFLCLLLIPFSVVNAQSEVKVELPQLKVKVTNIKKAKGMVRMAAYSPDQKFLGEETSLSINETVTRKGEVILVVNIPFGTYAFSLYHDEDGDGALDSNFLGIPKEPYGFSNNARGVFGPPKYKSASFEFNEAEQMIEIKVK